MGIEIASSFTRKATVPLDDSSVVADTTARDAIDSGIRYEGMVVYVVADAANYQLVGGITNSDWADFGGGGGGGGGFQPWIAAGNAAILTLLGALPVWEFGAGFAQDLYNRIRVPSSYKAGDPISLLIEAICASTSGTILFKAQATLIRAEVDDYDSTTNQRTTTNTAITMSSSNDKEPQKITLDISSSIGEINSVAISPGDLILIRLYRDNTDTATGALYLVPGSEEVTIS